MQQAKGPTCYVCGNATDRNACFTETPLSCRWTHFLDSRFFDNLIPVDFRFSFALLHKSPTLRIESKHGTLAELALRTASLLSTSIAQTPKGFPQGGKTHRLYSALAAIFAMEIMNLCRHIAGRRPAANVCELLGDQMGSHSCNKRSKRSVLVRASTWTQTARQSKNKLNTAWMSQPQPAGCYQRACLGHLRDRTVPAKALACGHGL